MSEAHSESIAEVARLLSGEKELREAFLRNLNELQITRLSLFEHEIQSLRQRDQYDPRLELLDENVQGAKLFLKAIRNELAIGMISVPKTKEGEAIVHGRIMDENGNGKANCEVSLVTEGEPLNVIGKSDDSGYYSIVLPSSVVKKAEGKDFDVYVRSKGFLVDKSSSPIKITGQEIKYELVIDKNKIKNVQPKEKARKLGQRIRKRK